jgi:hypothetical protein
MSSQPEKEGGRKTLGTIAAARLAWEKRTPFRGGADARDRTRALCVTFSHDPLRYVEDSLARLSVAAAAKPGTNFDAELLALRNRVTHLLPEPPTARCVEWDVGLPEFLERVPDESLLGIHVTRAVEQYEGDAGALLGEGRASWDDPNRISDFSLRPEGELERPRESGGLPPPVTADVPTTSAGGRHLLRFVDGRGRPRLELVFDLDPSTLECGTPLRNTAYVPVELPYRGAIGGNVLSGLVKEIQYPRRLDSDHQALLEPQEALDIVCLLEYLGLNRWCGA